MVPRILLLITVLLAGYADLFAQIQDTAKYFKDLTSQYREMGLPEESIRMMVQAEREKMYPGSNTKPYGQAVDDDDVDKMVEEAINGEDMTEEEKALINSMMKGMTGNQLPASVAGYPDFKDNKLLIPKKDNSRINSIVKNQLNDNDINTIAVGYYTKLMTKISATEKNTITQTLSKAKTAKALSNEATMAMVGGNMNVAMGLALMTVQKDNKNPVTQNNLAAILTQGGYPEKAIPILRKLHTQFPDNSTILNNMGFAWFNLGETDSSGLYFAGARLVNPRHPESRLCGGLLEELKGDPIKAGKEYEDAFADLPDPMSEKMYGNISKQNISAKAAFDKIKNKITIYPYFKSEWTTLPRLSNNVTGYNTDKATMEGYDKMLENLRNEIELLMEKSQERHNELADQSEEAFLKGFMTEAAGGISMMSLPAVYIQQILSMYYYNFHREYLDDIRKLNEWKDVQREKVSEAIGRENSKCQDWDVAMNEYLRVSNTKVAQFFTQKLEEYRVWVNAWCTWSWYVAGNPLNVSLTSNLSYTNFFQDLYSDAVHQLEYHNIHCTGKETNQVKVIKELPIPGFDCPVVVRMPSNLEEIKITAQSVTLGKDAKNRNTRTTPNISISYSPDNTITEPGRFGNPFYKTSNGSLSLSGFSNSSNQGFAKSFEQAINELWIDIHNRDDELMPLADPKLFRKNKTLGKDDIDKLAKAALTKELLHSRLSTTCDSSNVKPLTKPKKYTIKTGVGPVEFWDEETGEWKPAPEGEKPKKGRIKITIGEVIERDAVEPEIILSFGEVIERDAVEPEIILSFGKIESTDPVTGELIPVPESYEIFGSDDKWTFGVGEVILEDVAEPSQLQTVINNGLQAVQQTANTIESYIKGLFD